MECRSHILLSLGLGVVLSLAGLAPAFAAPSEPMAIMTEAPHPGMGETRFGVPRRGLTFLGVGPRYGVGGNSPLGEEQKENFQLFDLAALFKLPWGFEAAREWAVETRLLTSAGQLTAAGESSFMSTIVPCVALTSFGGRVTLDLGLGGGFFTNHTFGVQDFGGPAQIVGTTGIAITLFKDFHAGYRFQHFSDAGIYGPTSLGVDMHIMDVRYRF
jgi:hypothetical protein